MTRKQFDKYKGKFRLPLVKDLSASLLENTEDKNISKHIKHEKQQNVSKYTTYRMSSGSAIIRLGSR